MIDISDRCRLRIRDGRATTIGPGSRRSHAVGEYIIIYRVEDDDALILRVVHGCRELEALFD